MPLSIIVYALGKNNGACFLSLTTSILVSVYNLGFVPCSCSVTSLPWSSLDLLSVPCKILCEENAIFFDNRKGDTQMNRFQTLGYIG